jgi:prephenate dehydratase
VSTEGEVTEGRFTFLSRSADSPPALSRQEAAERYGLPIFVGFAVEAADAGTTRFRIVSTEYTDHLLPVLLGDLRTPGDEA